MSSVLDKIVRQTREDLPRKKQARSQKDLESMECYERPRKGFRNALQQNRLSVIAEVKKASPSKGIIRPDFDPVSIAGSYVDGGASAISVLTDEPFFQGRLEYLEKISKEVDIPLLRKDFIVDTYQIFEARAFGADAVLLIAAVLEGSHMDELLHAAEEAGLDALVECYSEEEVDRLDWEKVNLFGVNNRNLHTFEVDLHRGVNLLKKAPAGVVRVSESGLSDVEDLLYLVRNGIDAALIGEHFMRQPDPGKALRQMMEQVEEEADRLESEGGLHAG